MSFIAPVLPSEVVVEAAMRLGRIESEHNVTIVCAVESGSRAWGFPSPDSDNDVRFIYHRPLGDYLGLDQPRDVINPGIDGVWDIEGWDVKKAIALLVKGNATITEWLNSPLIYRETGPVPVKLRDLVKRYATPATSARHYMGLTRTCYQKDIVGSPRKTGFGDEDVLVNRKKYLYALRGSIAIAWVRRYNDVPPMSMPALLGHDVVPMDLRPKITEILHQKATMGEYMKGSREPAFDAFIEDQIEWVRAQGLETVEPAPGFREEANDLLLTTLGVRG